MDTLEFGNFGIKTSIQILQSKILQFFYLQNWPILGAVKSYFIPVPLEHPVYKFSISNIRADTFFCVNCRLSSIIFFIWKSFQTSLISWVEKLKCVAERFIYCPPLFCFRHQPYLSGKQLVWGGWMVHFGPLIVPSL